MTTTTGDFAAPAPLSDISDAVPVRMYAQGHIEIEAQMTDDDAALSTARRVAALIDAPAPADSPDSSTITVWSVEALAAVYGLLADYDNGQLVVADRDAREWTVGAHSDCKGLVAWSSDVPPIALRDLVAAHGPVEIGATGALAHSGFGSRNALGEVAARIMSLLLLHGVRASAVDHDGRVTLWNPLETVTSAQWCDHTIRLLRDHDLAATAHALGGAVEVTVDIPAPAQPAHAWVAVRRYHSRFAEGIPEWERDAVVLQADDTDEIAYRLDRGDDLLPLWADQDRTHGSRNKSTR